MKTKKHNTWSEAELKKAEKEDFCDFLSKYHDNIEHFRKEWSIGKLHIDWTKYKIPCLRICWMGKYKWFFSFSLKQPL